MKKLLYSECIFLMIQGATRTVSWHWIDTVRPLDTNCSSYLRYWGCYWCLVLKPASSLHLVNLLWVCFGYCSPLVQWDCNRCKRLKSLKSENTTSAPLPVVVAERKRSPGCQCHNHSLTSSNPNSYNPHITLHHHHNTYISTCTSTIRRVHTITNTPLQNNWWLLCPSNIKNIGSRYQQRFKMAENFPVALTTFSGGNKSSSSTWAQRETTAKVAITKGKALAGLTRSHNAFKQPIATHSHECKHPDCRHPVKISTKIQNGREFPGCTHKCLAKKWYSC